MEEELVKIEELKKSVAEALENEDFDKYEDKMFELWRKYTEIACMQNTPKDAKHACRSHKRGN